MRVLLVEDDPLQQEVAAAFLEVLGHTVVARCATAEAALAQMGAAKAEVALVDVDLAGLLDGISFGEYAAANGLPVIYLSGDAATALAGREHALDILAKPCRLDDLAAALARVDPDGPETRRRA